MILKQNLNPNLVLPLILIRFLYQTYGGIINRVLPRVSGDMLLGACYDLGVPKNVIEQPLIDLGLDNYIV